MAIDNLLERIKEPHNLNQKFWNLVQSQNRSKNGGHIGVAIFDICLGSTITRLTILEIGKTFRLYQN